jgi:hypothetical protein
MSSLQSFLRQIPTGLRTYTADTANLYVLIPGAGNVVGNYPNSPYTVTPGYMVKVNAPAAGAVVARDMGKTVFCAVSTAGNGTDLATAAPGFFRAVQLLNPVAVQTPISASNFGVNGSVPGSVPVGNVGDMGYNTFYVPVVVDGRLPAGAGPVTVGPAQMSPLIGAQL